MDYLYDLACKLINNEITFDDVKFTATQLKSLKGMTTNDISDELAIKYYTKHQERGVLYCLWNPVYAHYGDNVYKLGCTGNLKSRLCQYITTYVDPTEVKYESKKIHNHYIAEKILFHYLADDRVTNNREFFKTDLHNVKNTIDRVVREMTDDFEGLLKENKWVLYTQRQVKIICELVKMIKNNTKNLIIYKSINREQILKKKLYNIEPIARINLQDLIKAIDISKRKYDTLCDNMHTIVITEDQHIQIARYQIKNIILGVKILDTKLLKMYDSVKYIAMNAIQYMNKGKNINTYELDILKKIDFLKRETIIDHILGATNSSYMIKNKIAIDTFNDLQNQVQLNKCDLSMFDIRSYSNKYRPKVNSIVERYGMSIRVTNNRKTVKKKKISGPSHYELICNKDVFNIVYLMCESRDLGIDPIFKERLMRFNKYHSNILS